MTETRAALTVVTAEATDAGARLDRLLADRVEGLSRSRAQALIRAGAVTKAQKTIGDPGARVKPGDTFELQLPEPEAAEPSGENIALDVVYEDKALIVIDKPAGLVVHPSAGHRTGTLVNALIAHCGDTLSGIGGVKRPGIVHRLDKDTSGLLVVAKTDAAHQGLSEQFANHGVDGRLVREYRALAWGSLGRTSATIDAQIGRSPHHRTRMAVLKSGGRRAVTHVEVVEEHVVGEMVRKGKAGARPKSGATKGTGILRAAVAKGLAPTIVSELAVRLETGRTHQIRVHLAHLGHPVLGDATYGAGFATLSVKLGLGARTALERLGRQALHAAVLGFEHPVTGKPMRFQSPLPDDMLELIAALPVAD